MKQLLVLLVLVAFAVAFVSQIQAVPDKPRWNCHITQDGKCVQGTGSRYCDCSDSPN